MSKTYRHIDQRGAGLIGSIIGLFFGIITAIVALRFVFLLLGANQANGLVNWIYTASTPLVSPFVGIFNTTPDFTTGQFEIASLVALLVYGIIGSLLTRVFGSSYSHSHSA